MVEEEPWEYDDSYEPEAEIQEEEDTAYIAEAEEDQPEEEFVEDMDAAVALTAMAKAEVMARKEVEEKAKVSACSGHS